MKPNMSTKIICISSYSFCFFFCLISLGIAADEQQLMVCKPFSNVFETRPTNSTNQFPFPATNKDYQTSRPGKQGPRGLRGPPGPMGPPGEATNPNQEIAGLQAEIQMLKRKFRCMDGVLVGNTCYKLLYRLGVGVNYETARSLCAFHGMDLAEIPTKEVYDAVHDYVQDNWYFTINDEDDAYVQLWLGSSYDGRGNVILTNGQPGYIRWPRKYPNPAAGHNRIQLEVATRPGAIGNRMYNINPEHSHVSAPLCQVEIE